MDLDEYRNKSLESWDRFSGNWTDERDFLWTSTRKSGEALIENLGAEPGDTVLELAAGTGDIGRLVAERVGDEGRVLQTDFAPGMVESCRKLAEEAGVGNLETRQLDAERMDLEDDSVDGVICRWGYMLMADPAAALAESRRVLRDSGTLSFAVWAPPDRNLWAFLPAFALVEAGHLQPPEPAAPGIFAMADPDRIKELVTGAGFPDPEIAEVEIDWGYQDPDEHWTRTLQFAAPIADAMSEISDEERERVREVVAGRVAEKLAEDPDALKGHTWVVSAS